MNSSANRKFSCTVHVLQKCLSSLAPGPVFLFFCIFVKYEGRQILKSYKYFTCLSSLTEKIIEPWLKGVLGLKTHLSNRKSTLDFSRFYCMRSLFSALL